MVLCLLLEVLQSSLSQFCRQDNVPIHTCAIAGHMQDTQPVPARLCFYLWLLTNIFCSLTAAAMPILAVMTVRRGPSESVEFGVITMFQSED